MTVQDQPTTTTASTLVENRPVSPTKGLVHAFCATTDWDGPVWRQTWYGHHGPCGRYCLWLTLSVLLLPVLAMMDHWFPHQKDHNPFEYFLSNELTYEHLEQLTLSCHAALQTFAAEIPLECHVQYGDDNIVVSSHFSWVDNQPDHDEVMALPLQCQEASRILWNGEPQAKGLRANLLVENDNLGSLLDVIVNSRQSSPQQSIAGPFLSDATYTPLHALRLKNDQCAIDILDSNGEVITGQDGISLLGGLLGVNLEPPQQKRIDNILSQAILQTTHRIGRVLDKVSPRDLFEARVWIVLLGGGLAMSLWWAMDFCLAAIQIWALTLVVRWALPQPPGDYLIGLRQVTLASTWKAFMLLYVITSSTVNHPLGNQTYLLFAVPAVGAMYYKEQQAAFEWAFLAVLSFGFDNVSPILDTMAKGMQTMDALNIVERMASWGGMIVPGYGWAKLLYLYFVFVAYPPLREWITNWWTRSAAKPVP